MKSFLDPLVGKTWEDLVRKAEQRAARSIRIKQAQIPRDVEIKQWEDLRMRFNNTIIGIEKRYINIHPSGFSIRVLMKSDSKENRKRYAEEHRAEPMAAADHMPAPGSSRQGAFPPRAPAPRLQP